jgi:hypothetical protein
LLCTLASDFLKQRLTLITQNPGLVSSGSTQSQALPHYGNRLLVVSTGTCLKHLLSVSCHGGVSFHASLARQVSKAVLFY